ncbi:inovirus Gp2 family protein [Pectobacterium punjabense]|uniref:Inovirus Gp2 family protein n=1 Tax=Pectobacterium punjabense TaxID=2108399 RepID=A0ABX6KXS8_9GAMM|nr:MULTISPECIES: inovirus Gp2 family protein [Pectobacterium]APS30908.1 hypothetical protein NC16_14780 [Pectobacterium brasiliense]KHT02682.1 hypothetical protein RC91_12005 [Pectobacterium brasiliense]MBN3103285.1 inovirus Gp2 family protein [Pectobacterium brasiliense]MBN3180553.1 inovirus Gp2 family protein [Pectobacterium brasiliense]MBS4430643.1 inovirus Gp2 family protein [Pectobacterium punjabense]
MIDNIRIDQSQAPFNEAYLQRMISVINNAVAEHPRTMAIRVDLRLPDDEFNARQGLMSRFIESLDAKIEARYRSKQKQGTRTYPCHLRHLWVREVGEENRKSHYHVVLFVNKDTFSSLGRYDESGTGLASLIQTAWLSGLGLSNQPSYRTLVHFPKSPLYYLDINTEDYQTIYDRLTFRVSYFAKQRTKSYCREERSFGCSQR